MDARALGTSRGAGAEAERAAACAAIARTLLAGGDVEARLGEVTLHPHQCDAVLRARRAIARFGGALLADDVGLGKTYVALALARDAARPLVVCPAALREMWREAMARTGIAAPIVTFEALSRGAAPDRGPEHSPDFAIVDEAHHARTTAARRHGALATLCASARVLLLSATPLHNRRGELVALLSLFLGARARGLGEAAVAGLIIRRRQRDVLGAVPAVLAPRWLEVEADDALLEALVAMPPSLPASGAGDGGALVAHGLVRQWASSEGALRAALRRRLVRAAALEAALESGRHPTAAELTAWACGEDVVQLPFPELVAGAPPEAPGDALLATLRAHAGAVRAVLARLADAPADRLRAARLREVRRAHPGEKVVAFSCFAETVSSLFRALRADGAVAALTADGAVVAGGVLSRAEALQRFAPRSVGARPVGEAERIDLLLATDLLSEGVNLQDASVVVHLDLPWTPARLQQRVGRVARLGASRSTVAVYAFRPPASAEAVLRAERRLGEKLRAAAHAVGVAGAILPGLAAPEDAPGSPEHLEALRRRLASWRDAAIAAPDEGAMRVGAACVGESGFLAALVEGDEPSLVACLPASGHAQPTDAPAALARAAMLAEGPACTVDEASRDAALAVLEAWHARREVLRVTGLEAAGSMRLRRRLLARIARVTRRAPPHQRPAVARLAADARRAATTACGRGAERVLAELADADLSDTAWLQALGAFGSARHRPGPCDRAWRIVAMVLLRE